MRRSQDRPECIVIAGPNGSGKSTIARGVLPTLDARLPGLITINPDDIAFREFKNRPYESVILQAAERAEAMREDALRNGRHLLFETVFSAPDKLAFLRKAKAAGYFVRFTFIATDDPAVNCARVALRAARGGHGVPIDRILSRYPKSIAQAALALPFVDRGHVFDNTLWWEAPERVFSTVNGLVSGLGFSTTNGGECPWGWAGALLGRVARHAYLESKAPSSQGDVGLTDEREGAKASLRASWDTASAHGLDLMSDGEIQAIAKEAREARKGRKGES